MNCSPYIKGLLHASVLERVNSSKKGYWMRKIRTWWVPLASVVFLLSAPTFASAYIYDWTAPGVQVRTDPADDSGGPTGTEILAAYHAYVGTYHYFRMDLAAAPTALTPPNTLGTAETYGFYIDSLPGGAPAGSPGDPPPSVPGVSGIDIIVRSNTNVYDPPLYWTDTASYLWDSGTNSFAATDWGAVVFAHDMNGGATLEWRYTDAYGLMGSNFTWWAANLGPNLGVVNDMTAATSSVVPIPSAVWLLGSGIIGLVGLKRRQAKRH